MVSQSDFSEGIGTKTLQTFERVVVARTTATWRAADGSVLVANRQSVYAMCSIPAHRTLAFSLTASVTDTPEFRIRCGSCITQKYG